MIIALGSTKETDSLESAHMEGEMPLRLGMSVECACNPSSSRNQPQTGGRLIILAEPKLSFVGSSAAGITTHGTGPSPAGSGLNSEVGVTEWGADRCWSLIALVVPVHNAVAHSDGPASLSSGYKAFSSSNITPPNLHVDDIQGSGRRPI